VAPRIAGAKLRRTKFVPQVFRERGARRINPMVWWLLGAVLGVALLIPTIAAAGSGVYYTQTAEALRPRLEQLATYQPFQTSRIFGRDGTLLAEYVTEGRRDAVDLENVSPLVIDATVAVEDKNFWTNPGVDYVGIARSAVLNIAEQETVSGASTITQQFVKNVLLTDEERSQSYQRKIKEAIIAQQLTEEYSKEEILEFYLNENNYGDRNYGIQAAAQGFFGVDAKDLNLNQASLLAGLPQSPSRYNPRDFAENNMLPGVQLKAGWLNPERPLPNGTTPPRARQIDVLRQMVANRMIKESEARETVAQDLQLAGALDEKNRQLKQQAPHFVDYVQEQLENDPELGPLLRDVGGLSITTTIDLRIHNLVQEEVRNNIAELREFNVNNASVVVQQPGTGQILAMVGSVDYNTTIPTDTPGEEGNVVDGEVNVATRERQPGSALKPFVYLTSLLDKRATPGSIYWDVDTRFKLQPDSSDANINSCLPEGKYWYCPKNYDQQWHGPMRMRAALANSLNIPAVLAMKQNGVQRTVDVLKTAGITGLNRTDDYGLSLSLGGGEVKLLDLTTAYTTLANDGRYIAPTAILKITDRNGDVVREAKPEPKQVFDKAAVAIIRNIMDDDIARLPIFGTGNALEVSRPAAVKTGTTNDYRDGWAMGFTPYVTVGVWTGNNNNESIDSVGGVDTGGRIWNGIMERLFRTRELDDFLRNNGKVPLNFPDLTTYGLTERPVCGIGSSFGGRGTDWFTKEMAEQNSLASCGLYNAVRVVRAADGTLCLPRPGVNYGSALTTLQLPNAPQVGDDMRVLGASGRIAGGAAGANIAGMGAAVAPQNVCAPDLELAEPVASSSTLAQPSASAAALPSTLAQPSASIAPQPQSVPASPVPSVPPVVVPAPSIAPVPAPSVAPVPAPSIAPVPVPSVPPVPAPSVAPIPVPSAPPSVPPVQP